MFPGPESPLDNKEFYDRVKRRFGAVTSFSQISDANHIIVKLSQGPVSADSKESALRLPTACHLGGVGGSQGVTQSAVGFWPLDPLRYDWPLMQLISVCLMGM